ncbi:MAG TPA: glycosyltransferase [Candidatus Binatia bacterium]|nr:glycosyltransferase [Candidatus Binatia bacterium]
MLTVAYLANQFPAAVEPYVKHEVEALRELGVPVITGSVSEAHRNDGEVAPDIVLRPIRAMALGRALWTSLRRWSRISGFVMRVLFHGQEGPIRRFKALVHTLLGASYAVQLEGRRIEHIHAHHGFSASWIAMVAARLLGVDFSMTLHGSDVLLHRAYLDVKLQHCKFCLTVSEYNRKFLVNHYPEADVRKILVARLGVEIPEAGLLRNAVCPDRAQPFRMLAVGRLQAVKDHAFLVQACAQLQDHGLDFRCEIAGDGPERGRLELLIHELGIENRVTLLGHTSAEQTDSLYRQADLVVLTSRSEGIPLVLMEAMARRRLVLAPNITGIPELVVSGKTGFLYEPGFMEDFVGQVMKICRVAGGHNPPGSVCPPESVQSLDWIRHSARLYVSHNFNREKNLRFFTDLFLQRLTGAQSKDLPHACSVLQQI